MLYALGFVLHQDSQDKPALEPLESLVARFPRSACSSRTCLSCSLVSRPRSTSTSPIFGPNSKPV